MEEGAHPQTVGGIRRIQWGESGAIRRQRLLALDAYQRRITWELETAEPPVEVTAIITNIELKRVTANNGTFVSWRSDFSADVNPSFVTFEQESYAENLAELKAQLEA